MRRREYEKLVEAYIDSKAGSWADTTKASEKRRLMALAGAVDGNPDKLWAELEKRGTMPYARLTAFIRVGAFWDFVSKKGLAGDEKTKEHSRANLYSRFRANNARLFKNVYQQKTCEMSIEQARSRIGSIEDDANRTMALILLSTGLRYCEFFSLEDGRVVGKGGASRSIFLPEEFEGFKYDKTYACFRIALSKIGLKPHDLRKIFLTELVALGANEFELTSAAGWKSLSVAQKYIHVSKSRLKTLFKAAQEAK